MPTWNPPSPVDTSRLDEIGLAPILSRALIRRGFDTLAAAQAFLEPGLYRVRPATELPDLDSALRRIWKAIRQDERICVWGDFDVDGQTATTVLVETLRAIGANVSYHIPIREKESHGIKIEYLKTEIDHGAQLILTCDTGISEHAAIDYANARGVDVLVTDHHDLPEGPLPAALALVNPKRLPESHPLATLAGVGVAYKLAEALLQNANTSLPPESLHDLTALGLVADVASLRGETRYLVQRGLEQLRRNQRLGLQVMLELAETNPSQLTESQIGFTIGPRLNALGRLGDANPIVELFTTKNPARARVLAAQLEGLNQRRRLLTSQVMQAALEQLRENPELLQEAAIVLHHPEWPAGIIGIAASRLAERYRKPTLLLTGTNPIRGSARSVDGVHITAAIRTCENLLLGFGGHPMAAGLSLPAQNLSALRRGLSQAIRKQLKTAARPQPELNIDEFLNLNDLTFDLAVQIQKMAPFGAGNPALALATCNLELANSQKIGKTQEHLKLTVRDESGNVASVLWWGGADQDLPSGRFDLAYNLRVSDYKGQPQLSLELVDFRGVEAALIEIKSPKIETLDLREAQNPQAELERLRASLPGAVVFAEGNDRKRLNAKGRHEFSEAETLIVWSTPPGREVYESLLETVKPRQLIIFAQNPGDDSAQEFLGRLAGLLKFVIARQGGRVGFGELGAACGQGRAVLSAGFEYLKASGQISGESDPNGLTIQKANALPNEAAQAQSLSKLSHLLNETRAYRRLFQTRTL